MSVVDIPVEELRKVLDYNPGSGELRWKVSRGNVAAGSVAGALKHPTGSRSNYRLIRWNGQLYRAHRIAWALAHGSAPAELDHINGDGLDNRLANLRPCDKRQNAGNARTQIRKGGKLVASKGVSINWRLTSKPYTASIMIGRFHKYLGAYATEQEAAAAYAEAAKLHFGEFARLG